MAAHDSSDMTVESNEELATPVSFSVVIPTLNRSQKLARALKSAASQVGEHPEIIVVDDGSSPDEAVIIAAHVATTPRARLVRLDQNGGAGRARNAGVAVATGSVIAFLDSDDWWLPNRLARHRSLFEHSDVVATHNRAYVTREGAEQTRGLFGHPPPAGWSNLVALAGWNFVGGCSLVCVRREAFKSVGGFDASLMSAEDWDLWIKLAELGRFGFLDEVLGFYDVGPHDRLTTSRDKIVDAHERLYAIAAAVPQTAAERRYVLAVQLWTRAEIAIAFGDSYSALKFLFSSLVTLPTYFAVRRAPKLAVRSVLVLLRKF